MPDAGPAAGLITQTSPFMSESMQTFDAIVIGTGPAGEGAAMSLAKSGKRVLVVGSGPGGLEAARTAALDGHDVALWEKDRYIGGQLT